MRFELGGSDLDLTRPLIMGVINVTPDSFSDGGCFLSTDSAIARADQIAASGADIIDIGGESTRPGAAPASLAQELDRVMPVIESVVANTGLPVSVDTSKPEVMEAAAAAGAAMINDVRALREPGALQAASRSGLSVCVMHMQGRPRTMQNEPSYSDVVTEVRDFLSERLQACEAAGIPSGRVVLDPGFGFGKTVEHNLELLLHLKDLTALGRPLLVGLSRKSMLGVLLGRDVDQRLPGSLALALLARQRGANIIRVHDVSATRDVLRMLDILEGSGRPAYE